MSSRLDKLIKSYSDHIGIPWQGGLADEQRVLFVVYHKEDELRLRARMDEFRVEAEMAGHPWLSLDITDAFPQWMASQKYREDYFEDPEDLVPKYKTFANDLVDTLKQQFESKVDANTVVALVGCGALFNFASVSGVVKMLSASVPGRLAVFFPGEHIDNTYRLLDARDGWGYHATPIKAYA